MNIAKRFRNEIIIFVAFLFMLFTLFYKLSASNFVAEKKSVIENSIVNIGKISSLKEMWGSKKMAKEAKRLKTVVSSSKLKSYKKTAQKVKVKYSELNTRELNLITKKVMNTPFQISKFIVTQNEKESYSLELVCKW
jgi:hypothetical protein